MRRLGVLLVLALLLGAAPAKTAGRTVTGELRAMYGRGELDRATYEQRRADYLGFRTAVRAFSGTRRRDMAGVLGIVDGIAARGDLTPSRLPQLWLTMQRNRRWWDSGPLLASGARVSFPGSRLIWQYFPGQGLQFHPLANFGRLDGLTIHKRDRAALAQMTDELLPLAVDRAGGIAWEYDFAFDGGRPPWVSALAQGTALQALAKAGRALGREDELWDAGRRALGIFHRRPPEGVVVATAGGRHYLQYSFAPRLHILNGFIQSLVGLYDFASITGDADAQTVFEQGEAAAEAETPHFDTGAWSLYSRGSASTPSDLHYHELLRDFLEDLCERTATAVFCDTASAFGAYLTTPPRLAVSAGRRRVRVSADKPATLTVTLRSRTVTGRSPLTVPARKGRHRVRASGTDLAGNDAAPVEQTVRVR